jgi:hypothetical protein
MTKQSQEEEQRGKGRDDWRSRLTFLALLARREGGAGEQQGMAARQSRRCSSGAEGDG